MADSGKPSKFLRITALLLLALTVLMTVMGGAGTTCVAFGAEKYDSMVGLIPYKPLYQVLVFVSLATGGWGIMLLVALVKGGKTVYRNVIINLILGAVASGIQTFVSQTVRGSSAPVNMRFGITIVTLAVFLLFRIPGLWRKMDFTQAIKGGSKSFGAGMTSMLCGIVILTSDSWVGMTHLQSWVDVLRWPINIGGWGLLLGGAVLLASVLRATTPDSASKQLVLET